MTLNEIRAKYFEMLTDEKEKNDAIPIAKEYVAAKVRAEARVGLLTVVLEDLKRVEV